MKRILLSPPFSNLYTNPNATNIIGTYTLQKRPGLHRVLTTLRPTTNGWYNKVGLRNPGIQNIRYKQDSLISIFLYNDYEWRLIKEHILKYDFLGVEFNISCPNAATYTVSPSVISDAKKHFPFVSIKFPHKPSYSLLEEYLETNAIYHISNTKKTDKGALSGLSLVKENINTTKMIKKMHPEIDIIGGGGIYSTSIALEYLEAGAKYLSLSTALINPFKRNKLIQEINNVA